MEYKNKKRMLLRHLVSIPFIYSMIIPFVILDIFLTIYHFVCFALYGINYVPRKNYIRINRHKLSYLSFIDKFNCAYCEYGNGLANYYSAIAAKTEEYWCGIKQANYEGFQTPLHHKDFVEYGDEKALKEKYCKLRK